MRHSTIRTTHPLRTDKAFLPAENMQFSTGTCLDPGVIAVPQRWKEQYLIETSASWRIVMPM